MSNRLNQEREAKLDNLQRRVEKLESKVELLKTIIRLQNTNNGNTGPFSIDKPYEITCEDKGALLALYKINLGE